MSLTDTDAITSRNILTGTYTNSSMKCQKYLWIRHIFFQTYSSVETLG